MQKLIVIVLIFIGPGSLVPEILKAQEDSTLFREAKTMMYQHEYEKALNLFQLIKLKYSDSRYEDDADFWSAYILEQNGKDTDAFLTYQELVNKYPGSPWVDDALIHQIGLAEKFVREGREDYENFLTEKLESTFKNVRYQASLSLGKLGDERAIPALKEMENNGDRDMRIMAKALLLNFEQPLPGTKTGKEVTILRQPWQQSQNESQLRSTPVIPPDARMDKKDQFAKPSGNRSERDRSESRRKPEVKSIRPTPSSPPPKSATNKKNEIR